jgi:hypothetical protein
MLRYSTQVLEQCDGVPRDANVGEIKYFTGCSILFQNFEFEYH